ncbi:MAG: HAD-IA family hydrolase [Dehalococcoidia bacterium]|nr:HAD-IA family hydrolase [Dehalococcoidia bacterium]
MPDPRLKAVLFDLDKTLADWPPFLRHIGLILRNAGDDTPRRTGDQGGTFPRGLQWFENWMRRTQAPGYRPEQRVLDMLAALEAADVPWGIVTNGTRWQHVKLVNMGIQPEPECLVISKEFGHKKPEPEIFAEALSRLGGPQPSETLFVGDNPLMDIHGASNAGLITAWIRRGRVWKWGPPEPDFTIDHVDEVPGILGLQTQQT